MTISKKTGFELPVIDLSGPEGNAFCLLAYADRWGRQLGKDTKDIQKRMRSGDYENLVKVFDEEFGDFCTLLRD